MEIKGLEGRTVEQINRELARGARFVIFEYCISIIIMTFRRSSDIHFIPADEGTLGKSIGFTLMTMLLGWWGIPWGPIYTIGALTTNVRGGKDVTDDVLGLLSDARLQQLDGG